jgi:alkylation response protein AidB-like acyl-CoA dehydrogenase
VQLTVSPELAAYQARARSFIAEHAPAIHKRPGTRSPSSDQLPVLRAWWASLFDAGFLGRDWPTEWGGDSSHTPLHDFLFDGELGDARAPTPVGAWRLVANALFESGSDAQRRRYLPAIRAVSEFWCQLFSEPDAGSDLASLRCRAELDGDEWVVSGQKVWTTHGHIADLGLLLARTDPSVPKHQGISAFVVDMRAAGVEIRPLRELTGSSDFNEVFLNDVRLPADAIIGSPGEGWAIARSALGRERSESRREDSVTKSVDRVARLALEIFGSLDEVPEEAVEAIGDLAAQAEISDLLGLIAIEKEMIGTPAVDDAAITKVFFTELNLDIQRVALDLQGSRALLAEGDAHALDGGHWQEGWLWARGFTISAGSNEVMRNVISERGLGLPRSPL